MATMILDEYVEEQVLRNRAASGDDRYDEVWEGVYMMMALPNDEHQDIVTGLGRVLYEIIQEAKLGVVRNGVNVSDRGDQWEHNYRCPDVAAFLDGTSAINHGTHWQGGPDFAVEIVSPRDESRSKLPFYASVGTQEVLLIDRKPWQLELYRLRDGAMQLVEQCDVANARKITSQVVPLTFALEADEDRPAIVTTHAPSNRSWRI